MRIITQYRYSIVTALFVSAVFLPIGPPVQAQDAQPDILTELKDADAARANQIVREVERGWALSGSTAIDMLLRRGREAMEQSKFDEAIGHFTAAIDHAPDFAEAYHARATAYYQKDMYGPALADLGEVLARNPVQWNALFGVGIMMREMGEYARAGAAFEAVLDIYPQHEDAQKALDSLVKFGIGRTL